MLDSEQVQLAYDPDTLFQTVWSHYFIIGCSLASIVWGTVNVFFVSNSSKQLPYGQPPERNFFTEPSVSESRVTSPRPTSIDVASFS